MSDMGEDFKFLNQLKKERHANWHKENRRKIDAAGIPYTDRGETLLFRAGTSADFYPSTGRWRSGGRTYRGGAPAFLAWLKKQPQGACNGPKSR